MDLRVVVFEVRILRDLVKGAHGLAEVPALLLGANEETHETARVSGDRGGRVVDDRVELARRGQHVRDEVHVEPDALA